MEKRGHIIFAFVLNFIFIALTIYFGISIFNFNVLSIILTTLIIIFYALLPDVDLKNSTITWWFIGVGIIGLIFSIAEFLFKLTNPNPLNVLIFSTIFLIAVFISTNFLEHRGIIHTVWAGLLAIIPLFFLFHNIFYCIIAYISWHSHLLGDGYLFKIK